MKTKDERKRVALVDDDAAVLVTLETGLGTVFKIVAKSASGEEALKLLPALPPDQFPHLVLLDIKMPGMGGIRCCGELRRLFPELLIAMHTAKPALEHFEEARLAGADAYIVKGTTMVQLADALRHLKRRPGQCLCIAPMEPGEISKAPHGIDMLTQCEVRLLELSATGMRRKEMAAALGRSEETIKVQLTRLRLKLGVSTTKEAIVLCQVGQVSVSKKG